MTPIDWLMSGETGVSSETICAVMTGQLRDKYGPSVGVGLFSALALYLLGFLLIMLGCGGIGTYYERRFVRPAHVFFGCLSCCCALLCWWPELLPHWLWWLP